MFGTNIEIEFTSSWDNRPFNGASIHNVEDEVNSTELVTEDVENVVEDMGKAETNDVSEEETTTETEEETNVEKTEETEDEKEVETEEETNEEND